MLQKRPFVNEMGKGRGFLPNEKPREWKLERII